MYYELPTDVKLNELYCFALHGAAIFPFKRVWVVVSIGLSPALQKKRSSLRRSLDTQQHQNSSPESRPSFPPLVDEGVVVDIDLNDISLKAGYQSLSLDTAIKITDSLIHTNLLLTASDHNYQDGLQNEGNEIFKAH